MSRLPWCIESGHVPVMCPAAPPFDPAWIIDDRLGVNDTDGFQEHDQVMIGVCQAQDLVSTVPVDCDTSATGRGRPVHDNWRAAHTSRVH